jgi:hypothetical protein
VRPALVAATALVAGLSATSASGTTGRYAYWKLSIAGVQTMHWTTTDEFFAADGSGGCFVTHHGDQTIHFATPGAVRVRLGSGYTTTLFTRHGNGWRALVPLVGTEQRVHTVISAPPDLSDCHDKAGARVASSPCSSTEPLIPGAVIKVDLERRPKQVSMFIPFGYGFQPAFPDCHSEGFDITNNFLSPLFTRGAMLQLHGGSFASRRTRRLSGSFATGTICLTDWPGSGTFVRCSRSHNATVAASWQMTFSR